MLIIASLWDFMNNGHSNNPSCQFVCRPIECSDLGADHCLQDYRQALHKELASCQDSKACQADSLLCRLTFEAMRFRGYCGAFMNKGHSDNPPPQLESEQPEDLQRRVKHLTEHFVHYQLWMS